MIAQLFGKIQSKSPTLSVIDCAGVGYEFTHTPNTAEAMGPEGESCRVFIHMAVREDAINLFGFSSLEERSLFRELLKVSGIGPKMAISILSGIPAAELVDALRQKDTTRLQKIPGVGKKTADRLSIELSDRLSNQKLFHAESTQSTGVQESDLESVLVNLGYQRSEIQKVLKSSNLSQLYTSGASLEALVKATLKQLTQGKTYD